MKIDLPLTFAVVCLAVALAHKVLAAEPARVEPPPAPEPKECPAETVIKLIDAMCVKTGGFANGNTYYTCIDRKGEQFAVVRTMGTHS